jgi:Flp pilus assembly pilin Flp
MMVKNRRAQSTVEYATLVAVVIAVVLVAQIYMKRGFTGKIRESTDSVGEQFTPYTATYSLTKGRTGTRQESTTAKGDITQKSIDEKQTRAGTENPVDSDMQFETLWSKN